MSNNQISAKIIADSINSQNDRLTTMIVTIPSIVLAEFNTHRMFSRNSAAIESVEENPFIPIAWQKDHKEMQGAEYFTKEDSQAHINWWLKAREHAVMCAKALYSEHIPGRVTEQLCNRLLEPFMFACPRSKHSSVRSSQLSRVRE